jgi:hypothetical protein
VDDLSTEIIRLTLHRLLLLGQHRFAPCIILYAEKPKCGMRLTV